MAASRLAYAVKKSLLQFFTRQGYSASAAGNVKTSVPSTATVMKEVLQQTGKTGNKAASIEKESKDFFWMKDPKTGNWMPENHIGEKVDIAELRNKLLSKKVPEL